MRLDCIWIKYELKSWFHFGAKIQIFLCCARACISGENNSKSELDTTFWIFPHFFSTGRSAILPAGPLLLNCQCWNKYGKIQNFWLWDFFSWNSCSKKYVNIVWIFALKIWTKSFHYNVFAIQKIFDSRAKIFPKHWIETHSENFFCLISFAKSGFYSNLVIYFLHIMSFYSKQHMVALWIKES